MKGHIAIGCPLAKHLDQLMQVYKVPPDINEKEKIIGGLLSWPQFLTLIGAFVAGLLTFAFFFLFIRFLAILPALIVIALVLPFVFLQKLGMNLPRFLELKRKFDKKTHEIPNIRTDRIW